MFATLRKEGFFVGRNYMCCQSCGWAEIEPKGFENVVFYHKQDTPNILDGYLYLAWCGDAEKIHSAIENAGLFTKHGGDKNKRIMITFRNE